MKFVIGFFLAFSFFALAFFMGACDSGIGCAVDTDCPGSERCQDGQCVSDTPADGGEDAGTEDAGEEDAGNEDAGEEDADEDAGIEDAGTEDAGIEDAGGEDAGIEDAGGEDAGIEDAGGDDDLEPVDCSGIVANVSYELCESSADHCAGVFTHGEGCLSYCAAAGLICTARFGGDEGCSKEPENPWDCNVDNGHMSDWCECGRGGTVNPNCDPDPNNPPQARTLYYKDNGVTFDPRSSWVLLCRDYAYTAQYAEHEECGDDLYQAGSGRGTATFVFNVPRGQYDVYIEGRHTANRNPSGAKVIVSSAGQSYVAYIMQRDDSGLVLSDLHGRYCLDGAVTVVMDSSVSSASDSVRRVILTPVP